MATLQSNTFTVELNKGSENISRAARRLIFNADVLKAAKVCTGDVVILSNGDMSTTVRFSYSLIVFLFLLWGDIFALTFIIFEQGKFAVGVVWPSLDLPQTSEFRMSNIETQLSSHCI